jgi:cysteine desulfurase
VVFTGSGSEANNLGLLGAGRARVLVSAVEHASVLGAAPGAERIPVDEEGVVDLARLESLLRRDGAGAVVALMLANNETGVVQPVAAAAAIARRHGARLHCDAVQAAGKIPVRIGELGADTLALSAHKLGGPQGVGALVLAKGIAVQPRVLGGGQEMGRRAGTENAPGIAGFGAAAAEAAAALVGFQGLAAWRDRLERQVQAIAPAARVFGRGAPRLPNTSCLSMPGVDSETQVMALDLDGVAVSAGAACSSGRVKASHVLEAMGVRDLETSGAIRASLGWTSREGDVDRFVEAWAALYARASRRPAERPAA